MYISNRIERGALRLEIEGRPAKPAQMLNRRQFLDRLERELRRAKTGLTERHAVLTIDIDRFRVANASLGRHVAWVEDAPGLVLGRIVCQLVNEACFAVTEGVGTPEDIDDGMKLGLNYPRGPFGWLEAIGAAHVLAVLDALRIELGEERYRAAPMLRRLATEED